VVAAAGADVDPDTYANGRFASLNDPEGNVIQLWQPTEAALRDPT
jgi:glyoxylase I family protein